MNRLGGRSMLTFPNRFAANIVAAGCGGVNREGRLQGRSEGLEEDGVSVFVSREGMNRIYVKGGKVKGMY